MLKKLFLSSLLLGNICLIGDCKSTEEIDNLLVDANVAKLETKITPEALAYGSFFMTRPAKSNVTEEANSRIHEFACQEFNADPVWEELLAEGFNFERILAYWQARSFSDK